MEVLQSRKLSHVAYDVRGPALAEAMRLKRDGHRILELNIGNPAPFGFDAPEEVLRDVMRNLPAAQGYSESKGLFSARAAVEQHYRGQGLDDADADHIYLGNGVSELIGMALQALLDDGDEVLIPAPDYPLWTAVTTLCGGRAVHYRCDEGAGWLPDLADVAAKIGPRTKAVVVINPNNPTGAVYPRELLTDLVEIARQHDLVVFADEIYEKIRYDDVPHVCAASCGPDVLCVTMGGLSKAYRLAGFRCGWMAVTGPRRHAASYLEGLDVLANMRLCANVPAQHAVQTALASPRAVADLVLPGGRLAEQRDRAHELLAAIPGVTCVRPAGALYAFPRLDPAVHPVADDEQLVLDLLRAEHLLVVQGSGFNWPHPDHVRFVTLPHVEVLEDAIGRFARFLDRRRSAAA